MKTFDINKKVKLEVELSVDEINHMKWYVCQTYDSEHVPNRCVDSIMSKIFDSYRSHLEREVRGRTDSETVHNTDKSD